MFHTTVLCCFIALAVLVPPSHATMTCQDGYKPAYRNTLGGWNVICCAIGVARDGKSCSPESGGDYAGNCASLLNLPSPFNCNCGSLCSGKVYINGSQKVGCEGSCTCPLNSECNNTLPPVSSSSISTGVPSSSSSSSLPQIIGGSLFVVFSVTATLFIMF
jgi:hypothetical protein